VRVHVERLDPTDGDAFEEWYLAVDATETDTWPGEPGWQRVELREMLLDEKGAERRLAVVARSGDGRVVGTGWAELTRHDNLHLGMVFPAVPPPFRRRGIGSAVLAELERQMALEGRSMVASFQDEPVRESGQSAGRAFALAHGYELVQVNDRRDLAVPVPEDRLAALEAQAAAASEGYEVRHFGGRWPDEFVEDRLEMGRRMSTDAPAGEFDRGEEQWDEERLRRLEELLIRMDRRKLSSVAVHRESGRIVAFTELAIPQGAPEKAYQFDTLVLGEHRGHRLGLLVKLANLRSLAAASPQTRQVVTFNAADNKWMIAVNEALGCVMVGNGLTWQKRISP
jgi:GNAT superfamily N-acetyltransferase